MAGVPPMNWNLWTQMFRLLFTTKQAAIREIWLKSKNKKVYLASRLKYYPNSTSSFNLTRLALCGDISPNPGPCVKTKCKTCERTLARNHRTMWCETCNLLYHLKCSGLSIKNYQQIQLNTSSSWICTPCLYETLPVDLSFNSNHSANDLFQQQNESLHSTASEEDPLLIMSNKRQTHHNEDLLIHPNINSVQNKLDELKEINEKLKASIIILKELLYKELLESKSWWP